MCDNHKWVERDDEGNPVEPCPICNREGKDEGDRND